MQVQSSNNPSFSGRLGTHKWLQTAEGDIAASSFYKLTEAGDKLITDGIKKNIDGFPVELSNDEFSKLCENVETAVKMVSPDFKLDIQAPKNGLVAVFQKIGKGFEVYLRDVRQNNMVKDRVKEVIDYIAS